MNRIKIKLCIVFMLLTGLSFSQTAKDNSFIAKSISTYKADARGPYKDIRWFCPDGTTLSPQERCPEKGGVQRARYKDEVVALGKSNHLFFGQILSTTPKEDFWDSAQNHSRLKQYQLEQFLKTTDDGWVNRKAQYYRGAYQAEDEEEWGIQFYHWLLASKATIDQNYFLIRQSARDIPHAGDQNNAQVIRAISKEISDQYPPFMNLRVKIHGTPEKSDIQKVSEFKSGHAQKLSQNQVAQLDKLLLTMEAYYRPVSAADFSDLISTIPSESESHQSLKTFIKDYPLLSVPQERCKLLVSTAMKLRMDVNTALKPQARLAVIDASIKLEQLLMQEAIAWNPVLLSGQMSKVRILSEAAASFGYIELWEWMQIDESLKIPTGDPLSLGALNDYMEHARRAVEWGVGMVRATYGETVQTYTGFEPLAYGFIDDRVRSSVLLPLGAEVSKLADFIALKAGLSNQVMGISNQNLMRGLNPGYAMGELVVTDASPEELSISADKIYIFNYPPSDLKPVAGIATVSEGNMVSHVQLLARNLGIPNAVLSRENLQSLKKFNGQKIFYAVSNSGTVIMKPASEMNATEKELFQKKVRSEEHIRVPIEHMQLENKSVINLRDVNASHSGKFCGPKAANLGQLKLLFPENVVEGLVIPFGVFRDHFNQHMTSNKTYWQFLNDIFAHAEHMKKEGKPQVDIDKHVISQLDMLREAIKKMPLRPEFQNELKQKFKSVFGKELGQVPVFIRSDTNMEDLKDFTGAGLNLTLFNVVDATKILQGIKDVWASPYTERSYRWRQLYLLNPENVFPSILIIPSVNADCSGVMITKGVSTGKRIDVTIAFNRGVGGAVEGQASETWVVSGQQSKLLSPAREAEYMSIPATGGTKKQHTSFHEPILSQSNIQTLTDVASKVEKAMPSNGMQGPYDIELGLKENKVWLFQVRPFVENKKAVGSEYLKSISPKVDTSMNIPLNTRL